LHGVSATDGLGRCFGETEVQHLPLGDQLGHGACRLLDGRALIDPVLVVEVDVVSAEPPQRSLDGRLHVRGGAVDHPPLRPRMRDESELRGYLHLVAAALDGPADDLFAVEGPVDLGGVDVGHAEIQGAVDGADGLVVVEAAAGRVRAGHSHSTEPDAGDLEASETRVLHSVPSCRVWSLRRRS
jgi:hypothetical protein